MNSTPGLENIDQIRARVMGMFSHQIGIGATDEGWIGGADDRQTVGLGNDDLAPRTHRLRQSADISTGKCDEAINIAGIELRCSAALQPLRKCASDADVLVDHHKVTAERRIFVLHMTGREERHCGAFSETIRTGAIWALPEPGREPSSGRQRSQDRVRDSANARDHTISGRQRTVTDTDLSGSRHELRDLHRIGAQSRALRTPDGTEPTVEAGAHHVILLGGGERRCSSEPGISTVKELEQPREHIAETHTGPALPTDRRRSCELSTKIAFVEVLRMKGVGHRRHDRRPY